MVCGVSPASPCRKWGRDGNSTRRYGAKYQADQALRILGGLFGPDVLSREPGKDLAHECLPAGVERPGVEPLQPAAEGGERQLRADARPDPRGHRGGTVPNRCRGRRPSQNPRLGVAVLPANRPSVNLLRVEVEALPFWMYWMFVVSVGSPSLSPGLRTSRFPIFSCHFTVARLPATSVRDGTDRETPGAAHSAGTRTQKGARGETR